MSRRGFAGFIGPKCLICGHASSLHIDRLYSCQVIGCDCLVYEPLGLGVVSVLGGPVEMRLPATTEAERRLVHSMLVPRKYLGG